MSNDSPIYESPLAHGALHGCFGCGADNDAGLQLHFFVDESGRVLCHLRLASRFQGPPGHAHGGIIATLLDEAMSKANRHRNVVAMTRQLSVDYHRPVRLDMDLILEGWSKTAPDSASGRRHLCSSELRDSGGAVLASATGTFIAVTPDHLRHSQQSGS